MTVGRFAGAEMSKFMGGGVKFGDMANTSRNMTSQMNSQTSLSDAQVGGTALTTAADVQATKLISEAQAKLGAAQSQASGMQAMASGIAGGIGNMSFGGGGGTGGGGYGTNLQTSANKYNWSPGSYSSGFSFTDATPNGWSISPQATPNFSNFSLFGK